MALAIRDFIMKKKFEAMYSVRSSYATERKERR